MPTIYGSLHAPLSRLQMLETFEIRFLIHDKRMTDLSLERHRLKLHAP
jgi:hypothetical protein